MKQPTGGLEGGRATADAADAADVLESAVSLSWDCAGDKAAGDNPAHK